MLSLTAPSPITLHDLENALDGRLVLPSNARYASSRLVYDLRYETERPLEIFDAYGGEINSLRPDATVHRDALFGVQMTLEFSPDADPATIEQHSPWLEQAAPALAPSCNGEAYQNYIDPTLKDWEKAYYGSNQAPVGGEASLRPRRRLPVLPVNPFGAMSPRNTCYFSIEAIGDDDG